MLLSVCINSDDDATQEEIEKIYLAAKIIYANVTSQWNLDIRMNGNTASLKKGILKYDLEKNFIGYNLEPYDPSKFLSMIESKKDKNVTLTFRRPRREKTAVFFGYVDSWGEFRGEGAEISYSWPKMTTLETRLPKLREELLSRLHRQSRTSRLPSPYPNSRPPRDELH